MVVAFLHRVGREREWECVCVSAFVRGGVGDACCAGEEGRVAISLLPSFPFQLRGVTGTWDVS